MTYTDTFRKDWSDEIQKGWDRFHHAFTVIEEEHRLTHEGFLHHASHRVNDLSSPGGQFNLLFSVPAGVRPHLRKINFHLQGAPCDIAIYEGTTTSADGTGITSYNRNRNSSITPGSVLTHTPTITGDGTLIHDLYVPTSGKDIGSSNLGLGEEWVLAPSTKYLIRLTNNSGAVLDFSVEFMWYELAYTS